MNIYGSRKVVATAGTPVQLSSTNVPVKKLIIVPLTTNTGVVAIGGNGTTLATAGSEKGWVAKANANPLELYDIDLSQVYVDASANGEGIGFTYEL